MSGNPIKDTFYYDVSEYERKKNPNITNEEVFAKAQEYRQKPESFYSKVYKDLNGVSIDNKTLNEASIQTGIKMDPNKLSPDSINWVDNDKRDLIEEKKQINKLQSSISVPLDATDAEIDQFYKKEVFPKNQSRVAEDTGGLEAKRIEWINSEKKRISDLSQKKNAYNEKYPNVDLKPVPVDNFFKDSQKVTSKNKAIGNVAAAGVSQGFIAMGGEVLSSAWDSAKDWFSGNDAKQERINAKLDSEAYVQVLEEKAKKRFENIKDPVEKKILNEMFSGKKPQVPEGYKASKEMDAFLNDYDNLNVQLDINATQFGSMVGGKKKTYAQQLQDHEAEVAKVRDEDQNWLTKGKKNSPSVGRTWVNMALNGMVEGVDLLFDAFGTNTREERLKEAKKSGNTEEYLKLQRSFALDDFKEDQKNIEETAQRTDLTAPMWEKRVDVDGFKIQLDNKGNVQRLVDNSGKTVHTLSNSQQNAIAKYQANPEKYKVEEGFSSNATGSLINAVGTTTVQMIPMIIGGIATAPLRGVGALGTFAANTIPMSTMFVPQYARYFNEEFEKSGDWTRASKYGTAMAGFESMIEWVGGVESRFAQRLTGPTNLRQAVSEAGRRTADFALNVDNLANFSYTGKFFKELGKDIGTEMAEEIATLYGQAAIDGAYGNDSTVDFNELLTTLLVTPFATAPLASISSAANYKNNKNEFKGMVIAASNDYDKTADIMGTLIAAGTIKKEDAEKKLELVKAVTDRRTNYAERAGNRKLNFTNEENTQLEDYMYEEAMGTINGKKVNYDKEVDAIIAAALKRTVFDSAQEENEPVILDDNDEDIDYTEAPIEEPETETVVEETPVTENTDEVGPQIPIEPGPDGEEIIPDEEGSSSPDFDESKQYSSGIVDLWLRWKNRPKKVATEDNFQKHKTIGVDGQYSTYTNEPGTIKEGRSALNFNINKEDAQILAQEIKGIAANTGIPVRVDVADSYNTTDIPLRVSFLNDNDAKTMHSLLEQSDYYRNVKPVPTDRILGKKLSDIVQFGVGNMKDLRNAQDIIENSTKDEEGNYIYEKDGDLIPLSPQEYEQIGEFLLRAEKNWDNASRQEFVSEEPPKVPYQRPVDVAANNNGNLGSDQSRTGGEVQTRVTDEKQAERLNSKPNVSLNTAFEYQDGDLKEIPVSYKGTNGLLKVNQGGVVEFENGRSTYEFGNISDIGNKSLSDLGIESTIDFRANAKNELIIGDRTFVNLYDSPEGAINYDENGNVQSVDLQEKIVTGGYNGIKTGTTYQPITFTGAQAMDVAVMLIENNIIINPEERAIFEMAPIVGVEPVYVKPDVNIYTVTQNLLPFFPNDPEKASDMAKMYFIVANRMSANFQIQFPTPESYVISRINKINDSVVYNENNMLVQYLRGLLNSTDIDIETMQNIMDYIDNLSRVSEIYGEEAKTPEQIDAELRDLIENTPGVVLRTGTINGEDAFFAFPGQSPWGDISKELKSGNASAYVLSDDFRAKDLSDIVFSEYMEQDLSQEFMNQGYDGAIVMDVDGEPVIHVYNLAKLSLLDQRFPDLRSAPKLEEVIRDQDEEFDDLISGSAVENRKNGFFVKNGIRYDRNTEVKGITGNKGMVSFTRKVEVPYIYMAVEASTLQPSHTSGIINPLYFIPEAQPKPRTDIASINAELSFANNPDFTKLGENTMAYSGAPIINQYGEAVQGNNRIAGLKLGYNQRNRDYRKAIIENAEKFGLNQDDVMMMKEPILVRKLNVTDEYAIELGNYDVKDLETGGTERINPGRIAMRIPFETKGQITNALFVGEEDLTTLAAIRQNQQRILPFIYPHLNEAQRNTMTNADGTLNDKGIDDVAGVINYFLFNGGDVELPQIFEDLTDVQKKGLLKALPYIFSVPIAKSILPEIQNAIIIMSTYLNSSTKDFDQWTRQIDMFTGGTPTNMYTPFELALVNMIRLAKTQKEVRLKIGEYSVAVLPREGDIFSPASDGMTKKDAIKQVFNVEYDEKVKQESPSRGTEAPVGQKNQNIEGDQGGANEVIEESNGIAPANNSTIASDYLFTGGKDVILSTDYLLQALIGSFIFAATPINIIRNKYADKIGNIKDDINTDVYNSIMQEIREALNNSYSNPNIEVIFDKILKNPTGFTYREGSSVSIELDKLNEEDGIPAEGVEPTVALEANIEETPQEPVVNSQPKMQGFTDGKDLNRIFSASKAKYGDKDGAKYNDAANRLVNPNTNTIIEVRSNGVVVKEGDKYSLIPFTNTDANYKKWTLGRPLDVTEQYAEQQPVGVKAKIGQDVNISGLDTSYKLTPISPQEAMYKQGYRYNGRFDFPVSLGENGNYSDDNLYKEIPTEQQVIDDIIKTLKYELETYNEDEYLSGRDESIKEALDKLNLESFTPKKPVIVPQGNPLSNFESGTFVYRDTPNGRQEFYIFNATGNKWELISRPGGKTVYIDSNEVGFEKLDVVENPLLFTEEIQSVEDALNRVSELDYMKNTFIWQTYTSSKVKLAVYKTGIHSNGKKATIAERNDLYNELIMASGILNNFIQKEEELALSKNNILGIETLKVKKNEPNNVVLKEKYTNYPDTEYEGGFTFLGDLNNKENVNQSIPFAVGYFGDNNGNRYEYATASNNVSEIIDIIRGFDNQEAILQVYNPMTKQRNAFTIYPFANEYTNESVGLVTTTPEVQPKGVIRTEPEPMILPEGVPSGRITTNDLGSYTAEQVMINMMSLLPEYTDIITDALEISRALVEIDEKPIFPYRFYSQLLNNNKATDETKKRELDTFVASIEEGKVKLLNPPTPEQLTENRRLKAEEEEKKRLDREEAVEIAKAKGEAFAEKNRKIGEIKERESRFIDENGLRGNDLFVARLLFEGVSKDNIILTKRVHDILKDIETKGIDQSIAANDKYKYGSFEKVFEALSKTKFNLSNYIEVLKNVKSIDIFYDQKRNIAIERLNELLGTGRKPIVLKDITILPPERANEAEAQLMVVQSRKYYTLWLAFPVLPGSSQRWTNYTYLTTLSTDLDTAREKAEGYIQKLAEGQALSQAFMGRNMQDIKSRKTIALVNEITPESELKMIERNMPTGLDYVQKFGKYQGFTLQEIIDKDPDYAEWLSTQRNNPNNIKVSDTILQHPTFQQAADIRELEQARINAYEEREGKREKGEKVSVVTLVRGDDNKIVEVNEDTAEIVKKPVVKLERRIVKDQILDIIGPNVSVQDNVNPMLKPNMFQSQIDGANVAINSMNENGVVLNGDGAGVGKTRQIVAVADYYARQGKPVIIISENAAIGKPWDKAGSNPKLGGSMEKDSKEMGVDLNLLGGPVEDGSIYVSTYHRIKETDIPNGAIVIFDESQNLANTFGRSANANEEEKNWERKFKDILKRVDAAAYYSATPADKPHQLAYLHKVLGFATPEEFLKEAVKNGTVIATRSYGYTETQYYDVPYSQAKRKKLYNWINNLMVSAGQDGRFIKREISYEGTDVQFHDLKGMDEEQNPYAKYFNEVMDDMIAAQKAEYKLLAPSSYVLYAAELAKIGETVRIAKREKEAGRKVIIFLSRIKPMEIRGKQKTIDGWGDPVVVGTIPSPVDIIKEVLDTEGISFVELHGSAKKSSQQVQKEFAGDADALVASLESGGTGINLDDTVGDNPRTEIFMFSPYRGISTIQGMGRIWRASTVQNDNSPNRYIFITASDIDIDLMRSSVLAKKLQLMNAAIGGTAVNKLPMSRVNYNVKELVGIELPDSGEESEIGGKPRTGILKPVDIRFKPTKKGGFYATANADILEWVERGGPERTGLGISVFKGDNGWIVLSDKEYGPDEFAPPGINDGDPEALEVPIQTTPEEIVKNEEEYVKDINQEQKPDIPINIEPIKSNAEQDIERAENEIVELRKKMILGFYPAMASDAQKILELQDYVKVKKNVLLDEKIKQKSDDILNQFKNMYKNGGKLGIVGYDPEKQAEDYAKMLQMGKQLIELYIEKGMVTFKEIADAIVELTNETSKEFIDMLKGVYLYTSVTKDDLTDTKDEVKSYKNERVTGYDNIPVKDTVERERIEVIKKGAQEKIAVIEEDIAANDGESDPELDFMIVENENIISEADNALGNNQSIIEQYFDPNIGEGDRLIMSKEMIFSEYLDKGIMEFEPIARDLYHKKGILLEPLFDEIKSTYSFIQRRDIRGMGNLLESDVSGYTYDTMFNERPPEDVFIDLVRKSLKDNIKLNINSLRSLAAQSGLVDFKDTQIQEYTELAIIENAKEISKDNSLNKEEKYDKIIALYELQPTISMRSSTRIEDQQYSTPIPMSFVAGEFVNAISPKSVLEPSAGNGMMVFNVPSHKITVNEKDPVRLSTLRKQGFKSVLNQDGRLPFIGPRYDAIVTNPPFGSSPERMYGRYRIGGLDEQMSINALQSMSDNGRAAIIIGGHMSYQPNGHVKSERIFINYLYQHYNVVDIINMGGNLYGKQGTTFPTRMILIDGRRMDTDVIRFAPRESEVDNSVITNFKDLYNRVNSVKNETVSQRSEPTPVISRIKLPSGGNNTTDTGIQGSLFDQPVPGGGGESNASGGRRSNAPGKPIKPTTSVDSNNGDGRNDTPDQEVSWRDDSFDFGPRVNIVLGADNTTDVSGRSDSINIEEESLPYSPQSKSMGLNSKIPTNMAQPLYNILQQFGDIDAYVQQRLQYKTKAELYEALSAEQIDGVALAIYQIENGKAMIIGDMTGMGKGREAAAIIRYGVLQGKKPIFITEKPDLFSDMHRDLVDIKTGTLKPFIVNSKGDKDPSITIEVDGADGKKKLQIVHKSMTNEQKEPIFRSGRVPDEFDYVVATYSQFSQKESEKNVKKPWLSSIIEDNIFILDESHNAGGTGNTNDFFLDILSKAQGGTFLSATFAKRPDNMPVYALKTDISLANMSQDEIINAVKSGGLPLQQIMSTNLVTSGQMIRRERDFNGVTIDWDVLDDSKDEHEVIFDSVTEIFSDIIAFQREHVNPIIEGLDETAKDGVESVDAKGVKDLGISNTQFASKTFNAIRQLLLALKAKDVARIAIEELQAGRKPVIALANTMESFLNDMGFTENEDIPSLDFSLVLKKGLDGVLRYKENTLFDKKPIHRSLSLSDLTNAGREDYSAIMNKINTASVGIAVSPIDVMIHEVEKAGYKIGELTGRDQRFNINDDGSAKLIKRQDKDKKTLVSNFNSGELDALIINQSGSTGISLHASEKFKDRKQRVMLFAQTQLDINTEVQLRGRIDRTGQGDIRGAYRYIISPVPAEKRLIMMFRSKLKSLDANTKSNQKSKLNETDVVDFLNKYGDEIVIEYLKENQDINEKLLDPFGFDNKSDEDVDTFVNEDGAASKVSGRVALLLVREQEDFYREVSDKYNAQIAYLDANNANDLEIKVLPLKAETLNSKVVIAGSDNNNPFASDSIMEEMEIDVLKKPMKAAEIKSTMDELLGGKDIYQYRRDMVADIDNYTQTLIDKASERIRTSDAKKKLAVIKKSQNYWERLMEKEKESGESTMTQEGIQEEIDREIASFDQKTEDKINKITDKKQNAATYIKRVVNIFSPGKVYLVPISVVGNMEAGWSEGIFMGLKHKASLNASGISAVFAVRDGRRRIEVPLSKSLYIESLIGNSTMNPTRTDLDNWDSKIPDVSRKKAFIATGNLLQSFSVNKHGQMITFTMKDGSVRQGVLMPDNYKPENQKMRVQIIEGLDILKNMTRLDDVTGKISFKKTLDRYGTNWIYEMFVPKTKADGAKYFSDPTLKEMTIDGEFNQVGGRMRAAISERKIEDVLKYMSSKHNTSIEVDPKKPTTTRGGSLSRKPIDYDAMIQNMIISGEIQEVDDISEEPCIKY